ncbi:MAG: fluoride efflux transporter CrcB [Planctomycetes bacterium]|nr:fluoride efflux transporter CrcB [Planctomycetota bacterium]
MLKVILVFVGGGLGSAARYGVSLLLVPKEGTFPWNTFTVNVVGCFVIGIIAAYLKARHSEVEWAPLFFVTGILGGFTTFSSFGNETIFLIRYDEWRLACAYASGSICFGLLAVWIGWVIVEALTRS